MKNLVNIDIYAIIEATQELHFGNVKDLNVSRVELVRVPKQNGEVVVKPYMSPTKVRGVARRALLWELNRLDDDKVQKCGIPATCGICDLCKLYGALVTTQRSTTSKQRGKSQKEQKKEDNQTKTEAKEEEITEGSIASRVIQAGGVGINELPPEIKQRLSSPSYIINGKIGEYSLEEIKKLLKERGIPDKSVNRLAQPMPYEKEYVTGFFPVYWHCYMISTQNSGKMSEPQMIAYSFLETWKRIGAGHPKGADIYKSNWLSREQDLLVVDIYTKPLGRRAVISPGENDVNKAIKCFTDAALSVNGETLSTDYCIKPNKNSPTFERFLGQKAELFLQQLASGLKTDSKIIKSG